MDYSGASQRLHFWLVVSYVYLISIRHANHNYTRAAITRCSPDNDRCPFGLGEFVDFLSYLRCLYWLTSNQSASRRCARVLLPNASTNCTHRFCLEMLPGMYQQNQQLQMYQTPHVLR